MQRISWVPACVVVAVLALMPSGARSQSAAEAVAPVHDYGDKRPGQSQKLAREWEGAPAQIPHATKGLTPITAKRNACVGCHGRAGATSGPPPAPPSHFVDLREAPGTVRSQVAASRWNCTACHVPQTRAPAFP